MTAIEFRAWPKTARLSKTSVRITEKLDGTNAAVIVTADGAVHAQSRKRVITPGKTTDNYGFAQWVQDHADDLRKLGEGYHYGEWWGLGIQRGYGLSHKTFSLFDTDRYDALTLPSCVKLVPLIAHCAPTDMGQQIENALASLRRWGSYASPGFMCPEGICVTHDRRTYKVLLESDDLHKSQVVA